MPAAPPASTTPASPPTRARRSGPPIACHPRRPSKPRSSSSSASLSTASRSWSSRPTSPRSAWTRRPPFAPPKPAWSPAARDPRAERRPGGRRWVILTFIVLAETVANIGPLGIPAIASLIQADLGLTLTQAGSFLPAYYLGPVAMSLFAGVLADRWGTAKMLVLGQALIAAGLLAASTAPSYTVFIALMVAAGGRYRTPHPASPPAAVSRFPPPRRPTA